MLSLFDKFKSFEGKNRQRNDQFILKPLLLFHAVTLSRCIYKRIKPATSFPSVPLSLPIAFQFPKVKELAVDFILIVDK